MQFWTKTLDLRVVSHDVECVPGPESAHQVLQGLTGLFDLLSVHAPRSVDHEDDRLGNRLGLLELHFRTGQQQEVPVLPGIGAIADQVHPDQAIFCAVEQSQVLRRDHVRERQVSVSVVVVGPFDVDGMRGAEDRLDRLSAVDANRDVQGVDGTTGVLDGAGRQMKIDEAVVLLEQLRIANLDPSSGSGRDRENTCLEQSLSHVFEQCRVLLPPDDRLINPSGLGFFHQPPGQFLAVDNQCQAVDRGVLGQRKQQASFESSGSRILKDLCDLYRGDLVANRCVDVDRMDAIAGRDRSWEGTHRRSHNCVAFNHNHLCGSLLGC